MVLKVLVLLDERMSNKRQSVALLRELVIYLKKYGYQVSYKSTKIKTSIIRFIPNIIMLILGYPIVKILRVFKTTQEYDIIISCGRRLALTSYLYSCLMKKKAKTLCILHPSMPTKIFDACFIPSHDQIRSRPQNNIVYFNGSFSYFDPKSFNISTPVYGNIKKMSSPYISLFVGGPSAGACMSYQDIDILTKKANDIAIAMDATLIISNSRRTPKYFFDIAKKNLNCSYYLYDINKHDSINNPYDTSMMLSDYFIITGDSISMISEAVNTTKPVYIFTNEKLSSKHLKFHEILYQRSCAFNLSSIDDNILLNQKVSRLNDMKEIVKRTVDIIAI
jgi:mitochondrial fission protein ELM1